MPVQSLQSTHSRSAYDQLQATASPEQLHPPTTLSLSNALECTLSRNPELTALRQNLRVSAEALEVAKRFPTSLNPTVSVDVRPWVFGVAADGSTDRLLPLVGVSWSQPVEFGHRTAYRTAIAHAEFQQTHWTIVQAELLALVQTYRTYETAAYRRDKLRVALDLAALNDQLVQVLRRQLEANQVSAADALLAEVENQASQQRVEMARQEYADALAALRQAIGVVEWADSAEPEGNLETPQAAAPEDEETLLRTALGARPEIQAARAQLDRSNAALRLARADRIPIPSLGPVYERNESGSSFYGVAVSSPIPIWNAGVRLVRQREAECCRDVVALRQTEQQIAVQVKSTLARWNQVRQLATRTDAIMLPIKEHVARMERLYAAGQSDLVKLLQVRQRWIESANTRLDATWQATQTYADLLASLGGAPLLGSLPVEPQR